MTHSETQAQTQEAAPARTDPAVAERKRLADKCSRLSRIDDAEWQKIVRVMPRHMRGRATRDEQVRNFIEAVLWLADTRMVWRLLPKEYGAWRGHYVRFIRWAEKGIWHGVAVSLNDFGLRSALIALADDYVKRRWRMRIGGDEAGD